MATAHYSTMNYQQHNSGNQCVDPSDMENWVDFGNLTSPTPGSSKMPVLSGMTSPTSTIIPLEAEDQIPVAPSHDYGRFKQQTGLPSGAMASLRAMNEEQNVFTNFNSGIDEFSFSNFEGMGSQNGFGSMAGDMGMDSSLPPFFYPNDSQNDDFVDPTAILKQEETQANIRYYPGVHQQAALRAQQAAQAQREQVLQKQREAERQRRTSHQSVDPHAEETIARVVNQIRQNNMMHGDSMSPDHGMMPHIIRTKKDEDDMDEDERLLNSEEGKKLSSKERRQLRNKVSARAFRSRRKEYIGQLEGEINVKVNECNDLKMQNRALLEENARFRNLAEKLLGHAAFRPFLEELSRDPEIAASLTSVVGSSSSAPTPQPQKKDVDPYNNHAQQFSGMTQNQHVGMTLIPEPQIDFSSLNLGNNNWGMPQGMNNFSQPRVFAVMEVPEEPINVAALSGKPEETEHDETTFGTCKLDVPTELATTDSTSKDVPANVEAPSFDEQDPAFTLYASSSAPISTADNEPTLEDAIALLSHLPTSKSSSYGLVTEAENATLSSFMEKKCVRLDATCRRLDNLFASFGL